MKLACFALNALKFDQQQKQLQNINTLEKCLCFSKPFHLKNTTTEDFLNMYWFLNHSLISSLNHYKWPTQRANKPTRWPRSAFNIQRTYQHRHTHCKLTCRSWHWKSYSIGHGPTFQSNHCNTLPTSQNKISTQTGTTYVGVPLRASAGREWSW